MITNAFACYNNDETMRSVSSSGGIYPLLASHVIDEGGVVFAACYDNDLNVLHQKIDTKEKIHLSQGSKYVASILGNTFQQVKKIAQAEQKVLFVGTPCQCAGLLSFLETQCVSRENVTIVDFVCHGVPGRVTWKAYKKSLGKKTLD